MTVWRRLALSSGVIIASVFSSVSASATKARHATASTTHSHAPTTSERVINHITNIIPSIQHEASKERSQTLCLALGLYHEARGESWYGQRAVGHVILNRALNAGSSICQTLWKRGEFQWTTQSIHNLIPHELDIWTTIQENAMRLRTDPDNTQGATMFYNDKLCNPKWATIGTVTARFGNHIFIRV